MHRTFNCGIGMAVVVSGTDADAALARLTAAGERARLIGEVVAGAGVVIG
jgi:phosphoribosylformylglycinamidine cyclo-ligase